MDTLSRQQRENLAKQQKQFIDWVERPSKYEKEPTEPACFSREIKYMKFSHHGREFGDNTHTAWETFMKTARSKDYQSVVNGSMFPELKPGMGDWTFNKLNRLHSMYNDRRSSQNSTGFATAVAGSE